VGGKGKKLPLLDIAGFGLEEKKGWTTGGTDVVGVVVLALSFFEGWSHF
jgi:hypothetical protein